MIPVATTTIRVLRVPVDLNLDRYDAQPAEVVVVSGVRAHISSPAGSERNLSGSQEIATRHLDCDVVDLTHNDRVQDETTGVTYSVVWAQRRPGMGLDRMEAELQVVEGVG